MCRIDIAGTVVEVTLVLRFGPEDAARCRFAISPLHETMSALLVLNDPARHGWYLPWLRDAQHVADDLDLALINAVTPAHGHGPDFLWPSPTSPLTTIDDDLAQVRATDPNGVAAQLAAWAGRLGSRRVRDDVRRVLTGDPAEARGLLAAQQQLAWQVLIAPLWERIRSMLDADISTRARRLADSGLEGLFAHLSPRAIWDGDGLHLTGLRGGSVDLRGRGLVLVPTAFGWPKLGIGFAHDTAADPPTLVYPMLGAGRLWESPTRPAAITRLLGAGRAKVLAETLIPSTTAALAERVGLTRATVSEHLAVLRDAGLVTSDRHGREVHYRQTPLAAALLRVPVSPPVARGASND